MSDHDDATTTSRAVRPRAFGGPEALELQDVPAPHAGPGQVRVRVAAAGLNPMDWIITGDAATAERFGVALPAGFGTDYAGTIDEVGEGVEGLAVGDRVFGGAVSRAVADHVVIDQDGSMLAGGDLHRTPDDLDDRTASTLPIAACTAVAALRAVPVGPDDVVLVSAAAGGVGTFVVQLARRAGARVIGTGSEASADHLRALGAEPVTYGDGLVERVRALAPDGVTAAVDLFGTELVEVARELGVADDRIVLVAGQADGIRSVSGSEGEDGIDEVAALVAAGELRVPIAATFPVEEIADAVRLQAGRHVRGKVVVEL